MGDRPILWEIGPSFGFIEGQGQHRAKAGRVKAKAEQSKDNDRVTSVLQCSLAIYR